MGIRPFRLRSLNSPSDLSQPISETLWPSHRVFRVLPHGDPMKNLIHLQDLPRDLEARDLSPRYQIHKTQGEYTPRVRKPRYDRWRDL